MVMADTGRSLRTIFDEALELEPEDRRREFLELACAGDAALRAQVEELLAAHDTAGGFRNRSSRSRYVRTLWNGIQ
jgi:hypothetical protein